MTKLMESKDYIAEHPIPCDAYRIVEMIAGKPFTLFHGLPSSENKVRRREIPVGKWIDADQKWVRDGTGPYYWSGFNILFEKESLEDYMTRFTRPRDLRIAKIKVMGIRRKVHSRHPVFLADSMFLSAINLERMQ